MKIRFEIKKEWAEEHLRPTNTDLYRGRAVLPRRPNISLSEIVLV
jgi:hypothetical protein